MLSLPRATYLTSAAIGLPLMVAFGAISTWTIYLANSLYIEAKRRKVLLLIVAQPYSCVACFDSTPRVQSSH